MKKMVDDVFGEMEFNYLWERQEVLFLWGGKYDLRIVATDLDEEGISNLQRETFKEYWPKLSDVLTENRYQLVQYLRGNMNVTDEEVHNIVQFIVPTTFVIQRNGDWGLLFDCLSEIEHGLALYVMDNKVRVGPQDDFL